MKSLIWSYLLFLAHPRNWFPLPRRYAAHLIYVTNLTGDIVSAGVFSMPAEQHAVPPWHTAWELCVEYDDNFADAELKVLRRVTEDPAFHVVRKFFPRLDQLPRVPLEVPKSNN